MLAEQNYAKDNTQNVISTLGSKICKCESCDKLFLNNWNLQVHKKSLQEGDRYSCNKCD